jgi:hypothetical protein
MFEDIGRLGQVQGVCFRFQKKFSVQENLQIRCQTKVQDEPGTALAVMMA